MNKSVIILAIFALCLTPQALSSNMRGSTDRELGSLSLPPGGISLGNINNPGGLGGLLGELINNTITANATKPAQPTVPVVNNPTSSTPYASVPPVNNTSAPSTPTTPSTPVANSTTPSTPSTPSTPIANPTTPSTPVVNNTTPSTPSTPVANTTTPTTPAPATWYARNDVNMAAFPDKCLVIHNILRNAVGVTNLTWSDSLAQSAQAWAENMAVNGFRHSGRTGENIASTTSSTKVLDMLLNLWTREQNWFIKGCTYPDCSSTGAEVGHYTQMVWSTTTQVGCGFAPGVDKQWNYLCCQYYRAGNVIGQTVYPYPIPTN